MQKAGETGSARPNDPEQFFRGHYDHRPVELKWQELWKKEKLGETSLSTAKKPFYNLMMFPYPSAEGLHVGNMYAFTGADIYGRFKQMEGNDVFEPIGLDGFGIHSENYALKIGKHPQEQAAISEKKYYAQLEKIGAKFDWSRRLETYDPGYYRWTQWLFVQMFKHGLAYRDTAQVNWCPSCKTVLADEQVINGLCERCGNKVIEKLLEQWFFRITAYAEKLLNNLDTLDWSMKIKIAQAHWIGKKEGIDISYPIINKKGREVGELDCFTTRPDTNFGATFVVLAPEHPIINQLLGVIDSSTARKINAYCKRTQRSTRQDRIAQGRKKTGVFTGLYCVNKLNGYRMMLFVSDFVIVDVGSGAVVGVPGHDKRDFEFAKIFGLPIPRVVVGKDNDRSPITRIEQVQEEEGTMVNSGFLNGMDIHYAIRAMIDYLEKKRWGKRTVTYHLRDWLISRQRYWGPPIPMIYCETCAKDGKGWFTTPEAADVAVRFAAPFDKTQGKHPVFTQSEVEVLESAQLPASSIGWAAGWYPVPEDALPVLLPRIEDYEPEGEGKGPLARHKEFYQVACPECGSRARRETDVSDTFLDSSWYFLRYPSIRADLPAQQRHLMTVSESAHRSVHDLFPWDPVITRKWLPVDMYTGGAEHSVLHLMYSRFVTMAMHDWGFLEFEEPFRRFYAHGLVIKDGAKMSKSKGNVVNPDEYISPYGADSLRLYLMFMGPYDQGGDFRDTAMEGMSRWVNRVWRLGISNINPPAGGQKSNRIGKTSEEIKRSLHKLVKKVTEDIEKRRYNTAIAAMMEFTNAVADQGGFLRSDELKTFLLLLAPFAPFLTEELWQRVHGRRDEDFRKDSSIHRTQWPAFEKSALKEEYVPIVVQVNGKTRDVVTVQQDVASHQDEVEARALGNERVKKYISGGRILRVVFVPAKLINFVCGKTA